MVRADEIEGLADLLARSQDRFSLAERVFVNILLEKLRLGVALEGKQAASKAPVGNG